MKTQSLTLLLMTPLILACSRLDDQTSAELLTNNFEGNGNELTACEIPDELLPEKADVNSLTLRLRLNNEDFYFDGNPTSSTGVFNIRSAGFSSSTNIATSFDVNATHDFKNRDVSIFGNIVIRNDSSETQSIDLEFMIPVISDGTMGTSYSGSVSMVLSGGEIQPVENENLWSIFASCDLFSLTALSLSEPITANELQFINIGSYSFGGGNSPNISGESIVKEMGFRLRFSLSAGAFVSLTSSVGAHRELAP